MAKQRYKIFFMKDGQLEEVIAHSRWGIIDIADGFWINEEGKPTRGDDAAWWVPPSQLRGVEKVFTGEED